MERTPEKLLAAGEKLDKSINTAVKACFDAGADRVFYLDGHLLVFGDMLSSTA